jgi:hypothetical protein
VLEDADTPDVLLKFLRKVPKKDKIKWAVYVYLMADRTDENPVKDLPAADRAALAAKAAFKTDAAIAKNLNNGSVHKDALSCIQDYRSELTDKVQADIDVYDNKITQFIKLLKDTKPQIIKNEHEQTGKTSYTTNIDIINTVLENVIKIIIDKATIASAKKTGKFVESLRGALRTT